MTEATATENRHTSPWPVAAWLLFGVAAAVVGIAAATGLLMPAVVLDIVSFWPAWLVALLVALALWPLRRRGIARLGAVLPLLLFSWLGVAVGLHLQGWEQLPSSQADVAGPSADGITSAVVGVEVSGMLDLRSGSDALYDVRLSRSGGETGPPEALERVIPSEATVQLRERARAGWFRSSGWLMRVARGPAWDLLVNATEIEIDLRGLDVRSLSVTGDGSLQLGRPVVESIVALDGDIALTVPVDIAVEVVGPAETPADWQLTEDGALSGGEGPLLMVLIAEGADVKLSES